MNLIIFNGISPLNYRDSFDLNSPNTNSETSIQKIATKQFSSPNHATSSKKRKYDDLRKEVDPNDPKEGPLQGVLKRAKQNLSSSYSSEGQEEMQKNDSSPDEERMKMDPHGKRSKNGLKKALVVRERIEQPSPMEVSSNEHAKILTINELPEEILTMILNYLPVLEEKWNAPALVSRKWRRLFDDGNLLKCLKKGKFPRFSDRHLLISSQPWAHGWIH
jgi:hypothetical protein